MCVCVYVCACPSVSVCVSVSVLLCVWLRCLRVCLSDRICFQHFLKPKCRGLFIISTSKYLFYRVYNVCVCVYVCACPSVSVCVSVSVLVCVVAVSAGLFVFARSWLDSSMCLRVRLFFWKGSERTDLILSLVWGCVCVLCECSCV